MHPILNRSISLWRFCEAALPSWPRQITQIIADADSVSFTEDAKQICYFGGEQNC